MIKGIIPRLAEAGKIKIGGLGEERPKRKGEGTFRLPVKFDHFIITKTSRNEHGDLREDPDLMSALEADSDGKIRAIPIVLHSDEIDECFMTRYAWYAGKRCACSGDGEIATRREIKKGEYTGNEKEIDCPCEFLKPNKNGERICKPNGKLYCSIAAPGAAVAGAVHIWRTTSIISIERMIGSLEQILNLCGTLKGIPLWLKIEPMQVEPPTGGGPITVYCCHVELRASDILKVQERALKAAENRSKLGRVEYTKMLKAPGEDESEAESAEIEAEFYSEKIDPVTGEVLKGMDSEDVKQKLESKGQERNETEKQRDLF